MKTRKKTLFLNFLLIVSLLSFAQIGQAQEAIKVDKLAIEKQIEEKISNALSVLIEKQQYILDINIQTKTIINKVKKKKIENFSFSDDKVAKKDYFLFHKLGIEAPINEPEALNEEEANKPSKYEQLEAVKVSILLDELLKEDVTKNVEKVLNKLTFNLSVKPALSFTRVQFKEKPVEEKKEKTLKDFSLTELLNLGAKYSTSIGFLITGLFLSFVSLVLFLMYSKLQKGQTSAIIDSNKEIAAMAAEAANEQSDDDDEQETAGGEIAGAVAVSGDSTSGVSDETLFASSVSRFEKYFNDNKLEASTLLKKWINLKTPGANEGLILISQELDPEILLKTFDTLSIQDRKLWRNVISNSSGSVDLRLGARFIDEQILEDVIVPTDLISDETKQLLYSLDTETCTKLLIENPEFGPLLMNTLSTSFIVKVIPHLESDLIESLTMSSVTVESEQLKEQEPLLQEKLKAYQSPDISSPFSDKIMEILPHVDMASEEFFFSAFGKNGDKTKMKEVLKSFLPAKAIFDLPESSMKVILTKMKQNSLIEFLVVADEAISSKCIEIIAPEGSKKREVLDLELGNMQTDEIKLAKLKKTKTKVESAFIAFARKVIGKNAQIQEEIIPVIDELCLKYVQEENSHEQAA